MMLYNYHIIYPRARAGARVEVAERAAEASAAVDTRQSTSIPTSIIIIISSSSSSSIPSVYKYWY